MTICINTKEIKQAEEEIKNLAQDCDDIKLKLEMKIEHENDCKAVLLWKPPLMIRIFLHFPDAETFLKVWRYEHELVITAVFKADDFSLHVILVQAKTSSHRRKAR